MLALLPWLFHFLCPQSGDPAKRARAIVQAVTHYQNPKILAEVSEDLGDAMVGLTM